MSKREEQIIEAAEKATYQKPPQYSELTLKTHKVMCAYEVGFIDGCVWADSHPNWIPVEERLPKINDVASSWDCSDDVYIYLATGSHCVGRYEHDKSTNEFYWVLYGVDKDIPVTHWMPMPTPPARKEANYE